ncbi:MAG: thiopurine S-methyltransferase [Chromatiaceae bacterium]|nr:MAG: thiopurine S-methyltransferase [Chromatiaceae bacterium]
MNPQFWLQRWARGEIGWHSDDINPHLTGYWPRLAVPAGGRVFVPLCGKSRDLLWLASRGQRVLGVEVSALAVRAFLDENDLTATRTEAAPFVRVVAAEIELLIGDFFALTPVLVGSLAAVYDRAALIALPPDQRPAYVAMLAGLVPAGVPLLLITLDYDQNEMTGPPFAVTGAEVERLFGGTFTLAPLAAADVLAEHPRFQARGLTALTERVYLLRRRAGFDV